MKLIASETMFYPAVSCQRWLCLMRLSGDFREQLKIYQLQTNRFLPDCWMLLTTLDQRSGEVRRFRMFLSRDTIRTFYAWTRQQALQITATTRPEMIKIARSKKLLSKSDEKFFGTIFYIVS